MRDVVVWVAETLFYLQGGEMLINTPWIFAWVVVGCVIMILPFYLVLTGKVRSVVFALFSLVWFLFAMFVVISPGAIQQQMLQECDPVEININNKMFDMKKCRIKQNFYDEFSDWEIYK